MVGQNVCPNKIGYDHNVGKVLEYSENCKNLLFYEVAILCYNRSCRAGQFNWMFMRNVGTNFENTQKSISAR